MATQGNSPYADLADLNIEKTALLPGVLHGTPEQANAAGQQANNLLWKWILLGGATGVLGRAGLGLSHLLQRKSAYEPTPTYQMVRMSVARPAEEEQEKEAADNTLTSALLKRLSSLTKDLPWGKTLFFGSRASSPGGVPALYALGLPAAVAATGAGWKGTDALLDRRQRAAIDSEMQRAIDEYERLLAETMPKHAADDDGIEAELEELAELATHEKTADWNIGTPADYVGALGGGLTAYAILSALASGKLSYDYFRKHNQRAIAEEALQRRAKERSGGVAPIYLQPEEM